MTNQELQSIKKDLYKALDIATKSSQVMDSKNPGKEIDIEFDVIEALKKAIVEISKAIERNKEIYD